MRTRIVLTLLVMVLIVLTIFFCSCSQLNRVVTIIKNVSEEVGSSKGVDDILLEEEPIVLEEGGGGGNPYFLLENSSGDDIFKVEHTSNVYFPQLTSCDTIDTDGSGLLSCGTDKILNETEVEAFVFDDDNAINFNLSGYNISTVKCIIGDNGGKICFI